MFASQNFEVGDEILQIGDSESFNEHELTNIRKDYVADWLPDGSIVLMKEPERYINHPCEPNSKAISRNGRRVVIALKDIQNGEELTYDYGKDFTNKNKCSCGSQLCRNPKA